MPPQALKSYAIEGGTVKLGRVFPHTARLCLSLDQFVPRSMPDAPATLDYYSKVPSWPMYANDRLGDCVVACIAHQLGLWTALNYPPELIYTDDEVIRFYSKVGGYDPRQPWTDQGLVIADALSYACRKESELDNGTTRAFVRVDVGENLRRFLSAADVFGGLHLGVNMPAAWQRNTGPGKTWDVGNGRDYQPGTWGGHAVPLVGFDQAKRMAKVVTWGKLQDISFAAILRYCDEAYACVDTNWVNSDRPTPHGIDVPAILAAFKELGGGDIPFDPPTPPDPPKPPPMSGQIVIDLDGRNVVLPPGWRFL